MRVFRTYMLRICIIIMHLILGYTALAQDHNKGDDMNINFGIIAAMEAESKAFKEKIEKPILIKIGDFEFIKGELLGQNIVLSQSGVGKVNAAIATALMIKEFSPEYIINTGSAGGFADDLNIGDVIISSSVAHHDVDLTAFERYEIGQLPGLEAQFKADEDLQNLAIKANLKDYKIRVGQVVSGDSFIHDKKQLDKIQKNFPKADVIEMEAAAIAQTSVLFGVKFVVIRSVSDLVNKEENAMAFEEFLPIAAENSLSVVSYILQHYSN